MTCTRLIAAALILASGKSWAMNDDELLRVVDQRLALDRSGVCVAVARVGDQVSQAIYCANPDRQRPIDRDSRFEIGSISKAVQGVLVARLVDKGLLQLDEPLADLLPESAEVPRFGDKDILVRHLLTHTSGLPRLPSRLPSADPSNPYADLSESLLLESLADVSLDVAPGERFEYSNMGAMLLSLALTHRTGQSLDALFKAELLEPLGMADAAIGGQVIPGHASAAQAVPAWDFEVNLAGVGGLRASLQDMTRWLQAGLGDGPEDIVAALERSYEELAMVNGQSVAWGWLRLPLNGRTILAHDGGTGGFSSFLAIDPDGGVGAVVLADTSMLSQGSLGDLAMHLIDDSVPLGQPRRPAVLDEDMDLSDYVGEYPLYDNDQQFMGDFVLMVFEQDDTLYVQGTGGGIEQPAFAMDADGPDRFIHDGLELEIRFVRDDEARVIGLDFVQSGHGLDGRRR